MESTSGGLQPHTIISEDGCIGRPTVTMILDKFQQKAHRLVKDRQSLLVTAPTGSGKTEIALEAIIQVLAEGDPAARVFYVCPTKALINQVSRLA